MIWEGGGLYVLKGGGSGGLIYLHAGKRGLYFFGVTNQMLTSPPVLNSHFLNGQKKKNKSDYQMRYTNSDGWELEKRR